jgi:DNA (cytosine-5)-methyltransferase 1
MKVFSMFSGIGGFEVGLINALGQEVEMIGYSEINRYAIQIYDYHFGKHKNYGDCSTINWGEVPEFDLLVGGFPCQAFSIAGKRLGFDDTRGTLFFEIARCLKERKPGHFLLENVKGLLSHDFGNTFKTIVTTLAEVGYDIEWQVLNSKNFGVPQNRERVFFVGHLRGKCTGQIFPIQEITGVPTTQDGIKKDCYQSVMWNDYCIRRLTPVECERIQAFPDNWTKYGCEAVISDSQRYKTLGNAVSTSVVEHIVKVMNEQGCLKGETYERDKRNDTDQNIKQSMPALR